MKNGSAAAAPAGAIAWNRVVASHSSAAAISTGCQTFERERIRLEA